MLKCLSPFFIGNKENNLDVITGAFDYIVPSATVNENNNRAERIKTINNSIKHFVSNSLEINEKPIVLSGDCLSAIGCLAGVTANNIDPYLIWFDAHGDFHTSETTISGHLGGMPLAMLTGRGDLSLLSDVELSPIPDEHVYLIGGRDLEKGEKEAIDNSNITQTDRIINLINALPKTPSYWVHFDTDYIDPHDTPAMRYIAENGVPAKDVKSDLDNLRKKIKIIGVSISAWAPHLDQEFRTAKLCWDTISPLFK